MAVINFSLFSWSDVDDLSDLQRLYLVRDNMPDDKLIHALTQHRKNGRNDFPVEAMWHAVLAGIVFQHNSIGSLVRELKRNPALLEACGFNAAPLQQKPEPTIVTDENTGQTRVHWPMPKTPRYAIPEKYNFSRFIANLIRLETEHNLITDMIKTLREQLMSVIPDFGQYLGYDGKAIHSHSTGNKNKKTKKTSDPDADWGHHKAYGIDKNGNAWEKVKNWFGFTLHVIADTKYEIPVSIELTKASCSEQTTLQKMIPELFNETTELAQRCDEFTADRGLDCGNTKAMLWDEYSIKPLIDTRRMWRTEKKDGNYQQEQEITRAFDESKCDTIVYTEQGKVLCVCPSSGEIRNMSFCGFEKNRNTLKFRCPAATNGFECPGKNICHRSGGVQPGDYGRVLRINITKQNRRIFTPVPHGTVAWKHGYKRRTGLERINNRIDNHFNFERHHIRGYMKMKAHTGLAIAVMMAMAFGQVKMGQSQNMRSLVRPVLKAA